MVSLDKCSTPGSTHGTSDSDCSAPVDKSYGMVISVGITGAPVSVTPDTSQTFPININYECSFNSVQFNSAITNFNYEIGSGAIVKDPGLQRNAEQGSTCASVICNYVVLPPTQTWLTSFNLASGAATFQTADAGLNSQQF